MEEADGIGEGVLDEHALGVAGDELLAGVAAVVGEQDGGLVVAEVVDEDLAEGASGERDLSVRRRAGCWYLRVGTSSSTVRQAERGRLAISCEQLGRASAQGDEGDPHLVEPGEVRVGGELGVEDQVAAAAAPWVRFQKSMKRKISSASSPLRRSALE